MRNHLESTGEKLVAAILEIQSESSDWRWHHFSSIKRKSKENPIAFSVNCEMPPSYV
jgi:hypothetical protein